MLSPQEQARYQKQIILPEIGINGQEKIRNTRVLVIGAGGLGCPVLLYLAAAGVGTIGIADGDVVSISNLQRQILYTIADIGQHKAAVAAKKLRILNEHITVHTHLQFVDVSNALEIMNGYDIIVDGSDNFAARYLVNDACILLDKPMVSGAIYKYEGQLSVFNYKGGPTYRCIFPEPPGADESPNCADIGVIATLPGIIGTMQANEVIKIITGTGEVLSGKLLVTDTLTMNTHIFNFAVNAANRNIKELTTLPVACELPIATVTHNQLKQMRKDQAALQLIDVREAKEHEVGNIGGINIPTSIFSSQLNQINQMQRVVLYCASGIRSAKNARLLIERGYSDVYSLEGGMGKIE